MEEPSFLDGTVAVEDPEVEGTRTRGIDRAVARRKRAVEEGNRTPVVSNVAVVIDMDMVKKVVNLEVGIEDNLMGVGMVMN